MLRLFFVANDIILSIFKILNNTRISISPIRSLEDYEKIILHQIDE